MHIHQKKKLIKIGFKRAIKLLTENRSEILQRLQRSVRNETPKPNFGFNLPLLIFKFVT